MEPDSKTKKNEWVAKIKKLATDQNLPLEEEIL
jgi:hypothetical protein